MNSFRFFKKYLEGEYDKYSPFLTYIIEAVFKNDLLIVEVDAKRFNLFSKKGTVIADLILDNGKDLKGNAIILNDSSLTLSSRKETKEIELSEALGEIEEKIFKFFRKICHKDDRKAISILKRDFLSFYSKLTHEQEALKNFQKLDGFFRKSINKKYRTAVLLKWMFFHRLFFETIRGKEQYLETLQKNNIFFLFQETSKKLEEKVDVLSEEACLFVSNLIQKSDNLHITLEYILESTQIALGEKGKEEDFAVSDLVKIKVKYLDYLTHYITDHSEIMVSTSIGLDLTAIILDTSQSHKVFVLSESLWAFYTAFCTFKSHRLASSIEHALVDLAMLDNVGETSEKLFSYKVENENMLPNFKHAALFAVDFLTYPTNTYTENEASPISKNYKSIEVKKEYFRNVVEQLPANTKLISLQENHLLYNHKFGNVRGWLVKNFSGEIEEIQLDQPLCATIAYLESDNIAKKLCYKSVKSDLVKEDRWQLPTDQKQWFPYHHKNVFPLYAKANNNEAIFNKRFLPLFKKEKKLPPETNFANNRAVKLLKKPFNAPINVAAKHVYSDLEFADIDFYRNNQFLCIAFDHTEKDSLVITTDYFPTYSFLDKLFCLPLLGGKEFNISDTAYLYFRNILVSNVEVKFTENTRQKDQKLSGHIENLKKVTLSLPVLNKFTLQLEATCVANKEERVSKEVSEYYEIAEAFLKKVKILKKDARERKKLLSTIENEINRFLALVQTFVKAENACRKELGFLTKEHLFYYSLAILNSAQYKEIFGYHLAFGEPKIPFLYNMWEWIFFGKALSKAFLGELENSPQIKIKNIDEDDSVKKLEQIKILKKIGCILINDELEVGGLPSVIWEYQLKGKSPVEWKILELRKKYKGQRLDKKLKDKIVDEIKRSCNIAEQVAQIMQQINQLDFKLTY